MNSLAGDSIMAIGARVVVRRGEAPSRGSPGPIVAGPESAKPEPAIALSLRTEAAFEKIGKTGPAVARS